MQGLLDILNSDLGNKIISGISNETNQNNSQTANVLSMALPVLTKAMQRNANSESGASSLLGALEGKHDGSILNNLDSFFGGGVDQSAKVDGSKILNHVLGSKQSGVQKVIGQKTNVDEGSVAKILEVAAPILMGLLGNQKRQNNINGASGVTDLLGGLLGGSNTKNEQSFLENILDADGDGSVIDDVAGMFLNNSSGKSNSGGGLGNLLKGFFK